MVEEAGLNPGVQDWLKAVRRELRRLEKRVRDTCLVVVLLGAGGRGIDERRRIAERLEASGMLVLIPEDDFTPEAAPSLVEDAVFRMADVDLVFVNVESWGSVAEFAQFHDREPVASKLRVLTLYKHHPLYGDSAM